MLHTDEAKIKQYLSKYKKPDVTRRDIMNTINQYRGLSCKQEPFVFNDGTRMELCNLQGTIPVPYKESIYNIPICIWLMDTHPNNAPMCYVRPTADMLIKVSMFVDHNGKIYLPYLHDWVPSSSDLLGLIQVMIVTFGEQPPVFARPASRPNTAINNAPYPTQSYMPQPGGSNTGASATPYPPYPNQNNLYNYPAVPSPGYPPYPTYNTNQFARPFTNNPGTVYPPYPTYSPTPAQTQSPGSSGTITEEHIRASLLSAVEDKLRRRLREQLSQTQAELDTLGRTQHELAQGKIKLDDIIVKLEKDQVELDKNMSILQDKQQELEESIGRLSEQQPIDVDEAVTTTAPLYKQLLNAFAEEAAMEDAVYYLGEALRRGVIDLEVFLKQVRALSRKQFMLRALMHKCRLKAGLVG